MKGLQNLAKVSWPGNSISLCAKSRAKIVVQFQELNRKKIMRKTALN